MPYVHVVPEAEATGVLKELYDRSRSRSGLGVSNLYKAQSLRPEHMYRALEFANLLQFQEFELTAAQREMIATSVSAINRCKF